jgi:hypothetical protein
MTAELEIDPATLRSLFDTPYEAELITGRTSNDGDRSIESLRRHICANGIDEFIDFDINLDYENNFPSKHVKLA